MRVDSEEKALMKLKNRVTLLSRGITIMDDLTPIVHLQSRQGGPGPRGLTCYVGDGPGNHDSQISLVMYPKDHYLAQYALPANWWEENRLEGKKKILFTEDNIFLEEVPFNWRNVWFRRRKTAHLVKVRFHPYRTYATFVYRWCRHFDQNEGCKFCTNTILVERFKLPKKLSNRLNLKYLKLGVTHNTVRSVTLTSGTMGTPESTARDLLCLARLIREKTGLSIHLQCEPVFDKALLKELGEVADSIGIFLESFDEKVRRNICPGKARAFTPDDYLRSWEMAVSRFGRGKVWNVNMIGFDEDFEITIKEIERAAKMGVITSIFLVRVGSSALGKIIPSYIGREDKVLQLHKELGKILVKESVDNISLKNSGCMGCHGCSATKEAVMWARKAIAAEVSNEGIELRKQNRMKEND
ncbi:MAG: radical SAM protein [bacterium]